MDRIRFTKWFDFTNFLNLIKNLITNMNVNKLIFFCKEWVLYEVLIGLEIDYCKCIYNK
jgi:hypothetical protein